MKVLVYGAGAVGGYLGGQLALAGHAVTLVARPATAVAITAGGLHITEAGATRAAPVRAVTNLDEGLEGAPPDLIILGMKSYDLATAVAALAELCPNPRQILTTQNGIGVEDVVAARFDPDCILAGTVTIPVSRPSANGLLVERAGRGLGLAPVSRGKAVDQWVDLFTGAGIRAGAVADYRAMKWSKAFLNILGNATSAILNRPPTELYRHSGIFELEMAMLGEMLAVMGALGLRVVNLPAASVRPLAAVRAYGPRVLQRLVFTQVIVHGRGDKMPSFHIDLVSGKGRSEVGFHNGAIAAAGQAQGIPTPANAALNDVLQRLTHAPAGRAAFDGRPERLLAEVARHRAGAA